MGTIYPRGKMLWMGYKDVHGKLKYRSTGFRVGQERAARKLLQKVEGKISAGEAYGEAQHGPVTVKRYAKTWLDRRRRQGVGDVDNDEGRLDNHVLPAIGRMPINDVRPRHILGVIDTLKEAGKHAPRTIHNIYGTIRTMFAQAVVEELVDVSPCVLTKAQLPKKVDKNPEWRAGAIFVRDELELLISSDLIPRDRQIVYALEGVGGLRHGEMAGARWRLYDTRAKPLGRLVVARSYNNAGTKTMVTRELPVHPVLAAMLAEWHLEGWEQMMGRKPTPDDLIIPSREGRVRSRHHSRNKLLQDLKRLGLRHRRGHDLRRTFITLARVDGARADLLEMVTHQQRGDIVNIYTSMPWPSLCDEVAKLNVSRRKGEVIHLPMAVGAEENSTTVATTPTERSPALVAKAWERQRKLKSELVEAPGIEPGSESSSPVRLRNLVGSLIHPARAHRQALLGLAAPYISLSPPSSSAGFRYPVC